MMKKKHWKAVSVALILAISLAGCGNQTSTESLEAREEVSQEASDTTEIEKTEENVSEERETETSQEENVKSSEIDVDVPAEEFVADRSAAFELVSHMNVGWNLFECRMVLGESKNDSGND